MKITAVYTGQGLSDPLCALLKREIPGLLLVNIIDDSIIADVTAAGGVTKPVIKRLLDYYAIAQQTSPDYILSTCSSVGEVVDIGRKVIETPIIRIDEPMAEEAVAGFRRIGVIATLPTTLAPTVRLLQAKADKAGKSVEIVDGLAKGAYQALVSGKPQEHDALIEETAMALAQKVDCIVLAQGSMVRMQSRLAQVSGKTVLSSPVSCANYLKTLI